LAGHIQNAHERRGGDAGQWLESQEYGVFNRRQQALRL
jgi:hypothetical protein